MKRKGKRNRIDVLRASGYAFLRKEGNALYYENRYTGAIVRLQNGVCVVCGADVRLAAFLQTMVRQKRK